jgi:DNA polymerase-3 subunit alpha
LEKIMAKLPQYVVNFHAHTDGSLDGASPVKDYVTRGIELGYKALVITEHGNLSTAGQLAMHAKKNNIAYTNGIEVYLKNPIDNDHDYVHLTILFKNEIAYRHFCRLSPIMEERAVYKWGERKPIILWTELEEIAPHIVIGSGCLGGFVQSFIKDKKVDLAEQAYLMCRNLVPQGQFFVEVFPHAITHSWEKAKIDDMTKKIITPGFFKLNECGCGCGEGVFCEHHGKPFDIQKGPNQFVIEMAKKYNDPIIISEDSHFATKEQKVVQDSKISNGSDNWVFFENYAMKTPEEHFEIMSEVYGTSRKEMESYIDNTNLIYEQIKNYHMTTAKEKIILPEWTGSSTKQRLLELIKKHGKMINEPVYKERLKYEVDVLTNNGVADFLPYFFEIEQVSGWCKDNDILANVRGSSGGSLINYLIGASITDPIKYNLPFERFLTLGRILSNSIPDIDLDLSDKTKVIQHQCEHYGDKIAPLSINMNLKIKTSIKDAERSLLNAVRKETEIMVAKFPNMPQGVDESEWLHGYIDPETGEEVEGFWNKSEDVRKYAANNPEIWNMVERCLGTMRNKGIHACSYVITPTAVTDYFPLLWVGKKGDGKICTAFEPKSLEYCGGVKYDFLGVKTLNTIQLATKSIKERHGITLAWGEYEHDDEVYKEIFHTGNALGVFQFNTTMMKRYIKKIKPKCIEDLSAIAALVRPGTLDAPAPDDSSRTCADYFCDVASGESIHYIHPDMEAIIKNTNGIILYQEQTLEIFRNFGGYTFETAEAVRRAISKKDKQQMEKHLKILKDKLQERGWTEYQANVLCEQIIASAKYSFNKSHACVAYDQLIQTAIGLVSIGDLFEMEKQPPVRYVKEDSEIGYEIPDNVLYMGTKEVFEVEFDDGTCINLTEDHKVWYNHQWVELKDAILDGRSWSLVDDDDNKFEEILG